MEIRLTSEQAAAVDAPVRENLVSAAAGSGKTKVLTERIVKRIKSGDTSIDRLLVVTFTKAAAAQMRERISDALKEEAETGGSHTIQRQLAMIAGADICTIDSFCINLVKRNFFRVDVPSDFMIADENEMKILREEVVTDVLEEMHEEGGEEFLLLAEGIGNGKSDRELKDMILKTYFCSRSFDNPGKWLDGAVNYHVEGSLENEKLAETIAMEAEDAVKELGYVILTALNEARRFQIESYTEILEKEYACFEKSMENAAMKDMEEALAKFSVASFTGGRRKSEEGLADAKEKVRSIHKEAKDIYRKIQNLTAVYNSERGVSLPKIKALTACTKLFEEKYTEEKLLRKQLEFADCEYLALKILESEEEVCDELRDKYDEIYIDEYQDTNPLQDALFMALSRKSRGESNLFIVGDVKQSIYRFRHSDPGVFAQKSENVGITEDGCKMVLSKNFRSRREVIDSVNSVFEKIMRKGTAQVEYDGEHRLQFGAEQYTEYNRNKSEIYILKGSYDCEDEEVLKAGEQKESLVAANIIKKMVDEGFLVWEKGRMRKVRYSDIAVLSPSINNRAEAITSVFRTLGIPVYCQAAKSFFDTAEIETLISVLRCVDNPLCDIPLAAVMRSPIFAFTENELAEIRGGEREVPFYENVVRKSKEKNRPGRKCRRFIETIEEWRQTAQIAGVERFITNMADSTGYYSFVGTLPGGEVRRRNIEKLIAMAGSYENGGFKGLYNFVRYIDKTIENKGSIEDDEFRDEDSVLITSIHKSKGLEYPVVLLIGCGWSFYDKDSYDNMIVNPEWSIAVAEREAGRRVKFKTMEYTAISNAIIRDNHAEKMRLLYVAMTRAKEKLILIGSSDYYADYGQIRDTLINAKLSDYRIKNMNTYFDYVLNGIDEKFWDVNVIDQLPALAEDTADEETDEKEHKTIEQVAYRLSYTYPYEDTRNIPSKMSVSEIKKMSMEDEGCVDMFKGAHIKRKPRFMNKTDKLTGNMRGTAYHRVMELLDLNEEDVKAALNRFAVRGLMRKEQIECIDAEKIEKFLKSDIADRMRNAKDLKREESFTILVESRDIFSGGGKDPICVQGTIDCFFETAEGKMVLVDYKTDYYTDESDIAERYRKQIEMYELAVFARYGKKCDEKYLYMFQNGDIINM